MTETSKTTEPGETTETTGSTGERAKSFARSRRSAIIAAIFLMATSAIGPGFITQTATFTAQLGAAFGFAILLSVLIDFSLQMNVWRIITVSGRRAGELANAAVPFSGYVLAALVIIGGLAFNIGNLAGAGLGLNALLGIDPKLGGIVSAVLAIAIFLFRRANRIVDVVLIVLGIGMILLTVIVAIVSAPPVGDALRQTFVPDEVNFATITTIVGGTVGGYITYAGAHRYLDSGQSGVAHVKAVHRASVNGILITGVMRYVLFLAVLGVVASGVTLDFSSQAANPAGQAFGAVLGEVGIRLFGAIFWAAAISSVIGAAYTSATFLTTFSARLGTGMPVRIATVFIIVVPLIVYMLMGAAPAAILVFVGGFNGLILPIGMSVFMYIGWFRSRDLLGGYRYPRWLLIVGTLATALSWYMGALSIGPIFAFIGVGA